ncbi:MAG: hypothetical protein U9R74_19920 [Pseudomonadota bacterium]|nr:hypothetical protein [Pseudomonadota bacterium]
MNGSFTATALSGALVLLLLTACDSSDVDEVIEEILNQTNIHFYNQMTAASAADITVDVSTDVVPGAFLKDQGYSTSATAKRESIFIGSGSIDDVNFDADRSDNGARVASSGSNQLRQARNYTVVAMGDVPTDTTTIGVFEQLRNPAGANRASVRFINAMANQDVSLGGDITIADLKFAAASGYQEVTVANGISVDVTPQGGATVTDVRCNPTPVAEKSYDAILAFEDFDRTDIALFCHKNKE